MRRPRRPHIHFTVFVRDKAVLTSQLYFAGQMENVRDSLASARGAAARTIHLEESEDGLHGAFAIAVDVAPEHGK